MKSVFSFEGTVSRTHFWLGTLAMPVGFILLSLLINPLTPLGNAMIVLVSIVVLVLLAGCVWIFLALLAKRLRDAGLSPWLCLLFFVPLADLVVFLIAGFKPTAVERTSTVSS